MVKMAVFPVSRRSAYDLKKARKWLLSTFELVLTQFWVSSSLLSHLDSKRLYCRTPEKWFGGKFSVKWFGFRPESQSYRPKVGVTDQKVRVTAGQTPRIRTESPRNGPRMGFRCFYRKPPLKPSWIQLTFESFLGQFGVEPLESLLSLSVSSQASGSSRGHSRSQQYFVRFQEALGVNWKLRLQGRVGHDESWADMTTIDDKSEKILETSVKKNFGKGMRGSTLLSEKKGLLSERREAIQWMRGLVRISAVKLVTGPRLGHFNG